MKLGPKHLICGVLILAGAAMSVTNFIDSQAAEDTEPPPEIPADGGGTSDGASGKDLDMRGGTAFESDSTSATGAMSETGLMSNQDWSAVSESPISASDPSTWSTPSDATTIEAGTEGDFDGFEGLGDSTIGEDGQSTNTTDKTGLETVQSLEDSMRLIRNLVPQPSSESDLDAMLQAWNDNQIAPKAPEVDPTTGETKEDLRGDSTSSEDSLSSSGDKKKSGPPPDPLEQFLSEHALTGILRGNDRAVALMGGREFRVGDWLVPARARVVRIATHQVFVEYGERLVQVDLPPIRIRAASTPGTQTTSEPDPETKEGPKTASAPSAPATTIPSTTTEEDLNKLAQRLLEQLPNSPKGDSEKD